MRVFLYCLVLLSPAVFSIENHTKLPDPLTLEFALSLAEEDHPDLVAINHAVSIAKSQIAIAKSKNGIQVRAQARARWIDPPSAVERFGREDHQGTLFADKTIYDFGRTSNQIDAMKNQEAIEELRLQQVKQHRRIEIMQAFLDVVLSDLNYIRDNEAMTMGFLRYDRAKERQELGQLSEVDVLEKENIYYEYRKVRYQSESLQRLLRSQFSIVVNRPNEIISRFQIPMMGYDKYKLIDVKSLQKAAEINNYDLKIIRLSLDALRSQLQSVRANRHPVISAEVEGGVYERNMGSNDRWRAGLVLDVPLYQGGKISGQVAELRARIKEMENKHYQLKIKINQEILTHWLNIESLAAQKASSSKRYDYSELYLDRARAVYEMEVKSDLGDAMVQLSQASLQAAETDFEIAMRWEKLRVLTQMTLEEMRQ